MSGLEDGIKTEVFFSYITARGRLGMMESRRKRWGHRMSEKKRELGREKCEDGVINAEKVMQGAGGKMEQSDRVMERPIANWKSDETEGCMEGKHACLVAR